MDGASDRSRISVADGGRHTLGGFGESLAFGAASGALARLMIPNLITDELTGMAVFGGGISMTTQGFISATQYVAVTTTDGGRVTMPGMMEALKIGAISGFPYAPKFFGIKEPEPGEG
jgi:hypothetical protein